MMRMIFWLVAVFTASAAAAAPVHSSVHTARNGSRTMTLSVIIDAPVRNVWAALTNAEGWQKWASRVAWQVGKHPRFIETSYDVNAKPGGASTIRQQFLVEQPYRKSASRTTKAPRGFKHSETYRKVVNQVELVPVSSNRIRLRFSAGPYPNTPSGRELFGTFERGNSQTLQNMADVLGGHKASRFAAQRYSQKGRG